MFDEYAHRFSQVFESLGAAWQGTRLLERLPAFAVLGGSAILCAVVAEQQVGQRLQVELPIGALLQLREHLHRQRTPATDVLLMRQQNLGNHLGVGFDDH